MVQLCVHYDLQVINGPSDGVLLCMIFCWLQPIMGVGTLNSNFVTILHFVVSSLHLEYCVAFQVSGVSQLFPSTYSRHTHVGTAQTRRRLSVINAACSGLGRTLSENFGNSFDNLALPIVGYA